MVLANQNAKLTGPDQGFLVSRHPRPQAQARAALRAARAWAWGRGWSLASSSYESPGNEVVFYVHVYFCAAYLNVWAWVTGQDGDFKLMVENFYKILSKFSAKEDNFFWF